MKALWRELRGVTNWEKTAHVGAHRDLVPPVYATVPVAAVAADEVLAEFMGAEGAVASEVTQKLDLACPSRFVRSRVLAAWMAGPLLCASLLGPLNRGIGGMAMALGRAIPLSALPHGIGLAVPVIHFGGLPPSGQGQRPQPAPTPAAPAPHPAPPQPGQQPAPSPGGHGKGHP